MRPLGRGVVGSFILSLNVRALRDLKGALQNSQHKEHNLLIIKPFKEIVSFVNAAD